MNHFPTIVQESFMFLKHFSILFLATYLTCGPVFPALAYQNANLILCENENAPVSLVIVERVATQRVGIRVSVSNKDFGLSNQCFGACNLSIQEREEEFVLQGNLNTNGFEGDDFTIRLEKQLLQPLQKGILTLERRPEYGGTVKLACESQKQIGLLIPAINK
jgi:hypothetical protein